MADWLKRVLPESARPFLDWLVTPRVIGAVTLLSLGLFVASVVALPWFVARLPRDYFTRAGLERDVSVIGDPRWRRVIHAGKNLVGALLLLAGLAMLVLPGQGVLTIVVSLVLLEFPGKRALERRLVARPNVLRALNAIRRKAGVEPLRVD